MISENDRSGIECQPDSETVRATRLSEEAKRCPLAPCARRLSSEAIEQAETNVRLSE